MNESITVAGATAAKEPTDIAIRIARIKNLTSVLSEMKRMTGRIADRVYVHGPDEQATNPPPESQEQSFSDLDLALDNLEREIYQGQTQIERLKNI